jgi:hypothetical protein
MESTTQLKPPAFDEGGIDEGAVQGHFTTVSHECFNSFSILAGVI